MATVAPVLQQRSRSLLICLALFQLSCQPDSVHRCQANPTAACITALGTRAEWSGFQFSDLDLRRKALASVVFSGSSFVRVRFSGSDLKWAKFERARLPGADLDGADLSCAGLGGALLDGANLRQAALWGADLRTTSLRGADLRGATLAMALLEGADCSGANLAGADLRGATLGQARFQDAILDDAIWIDGRHCAAESRGACNYAAPAR